MKVEMRLILRKLLLVAGKVYLQLTKKPNKKLIRLYNNSIENVDRIYNQNLYWHGTGRYQYTNEGKIIDVLEHILKNNGLKPLIKDPWLETNRGYQKTISMAKIRQFASVYAFIHQNENRSIKYMYGSRFFWSLMVGLNNFLEAPLDITKHAYNFTAQNRTDELINFQSKARSKNKLGQYKNYVRQLMYMPLIRSDIRNNYAILFATKQESISYIKLSSGFEYYEARTKDNITFDKISHIEVPLHQVQRTKKLLKTYDINVPIIPIELGEIYIKKRRKTEQLLTP